MRHTLAMVGFGGMAGWHYDLIEEIDNLLVAGVWDIKEERREYARSRKIPVYGSLEELLADPTVELVLVATPNDVHREIAIQAMEAGKNVISEKPVALSSQELREMIEASQRTGRFLTVHQNRRWDGDFLTVKKVMESGRLGDIFRVESRVHGSRGIPGDWRQEKEHGGGMVLDWGVHLLDQVLLLLPGVKLHTVYGTLTHVTNQLVDDGFTADLGFENGVHILVEVGTSNFINLPRWYVLGTNGSAVITNWGQDMQLVRAVGKSEEDVIPVRTAAGLTKTMAPRRQDSICTEEQIVEGADVREFYQNVMAVLENREESRIKLSQVMRVMQVMEAIFQSAKTCQVVRLEE
ncbi:MAG: Gfo/Idh/MocA family oxidoreductase [Lachnospiraceae bacterium]|nr:Gfo/Idh/MocA family oxidoreductase [Lachnospiraceae bacterium]